MYQDNAIDRIEDDKLQRAEFSEHLADSILNIAPQKSWVIALTAEWGDGKTSVKNMMLKTLIKSQKNKANNERIDIVDFSPWQWSSQDLIYQSFFKEIISQLNIHDDDKHNKELINKLQKYNYYLNNIKTISSPKFSSIFIGVVGFLFSILSYTIEFNNEIFLMCVISILSIWNVFFIGLGSIIANKLNFLEKHVKNNKKLLSEIKKDISEELNKRNAPLLIILDDLDRLTKSQLLMIMQLVKGNSDFNNIIFLLLYSKSIIEQQLENEAGGTKFLEKIVQVEFKVPEPNKWDLYDFLLSEMEKISNSLNVTNKDTNDFNRFNEIFRNERYNFIRKDFANLRAIFRYLNAFQFNIRANININERILEVNYTDFAILEIVRVFHSNLYSNIVIYRNRYTDSKHIERVRNDDTLKELHKSDLEELDSNEFIKLLFPSYTDSLYTHSFHKKYGHKTKLSYIDDIHHTNKYFSFQVTQYEISNVQMASYIKRINADVDAEAFRTIFNEMDNNQKNSFLFNIKNRFEEISAEKQEDIFCHCIDIAEELKYSENDKESFSFSSFINFSISVGHQVLPTINISRFKNTISKEKKFVLICYLDSSEFTKTFIELVEKFVTYHFEKFLKYPHNTTVLEMYEKNTRDKKDTPVSNYLKNKLNDDSFFLDIIKLFISVNVFGDSSFNEYLFMQFLDIQKVRKIFEENAQKLDSDDFKNTRTLFNQRTKHL